MSEHEALEAALLLDPAILAEAARYEPVVRKLAHHSLVGLLIVAQREARRRDRKLSPTGRIGRC